MTTDLRRVHFIESEVRDTNPGLVAFSLGFKLELLSNLGVLGGVIVCTLDPDNCDRCACIGGVWGDKHDALGKDGPCRDQAEQCN